MLDTLDFTGLHHWVRIKLFFLRQEHKLKIMTWYPNRSFLSFPGPPYQNKVKYSAFDLEMIFHSHADKTNFHRKGYALGLILKVRFFGTQKWPIIKKQILLVTIIHSQRPYLEMSCNIREVFVILMSMQNIFLWN